MNKCADGQTVPVHLMKHACVSCIRLQIQGNVWTVSIDGGSSFTVMNLIFLIKAHTDKKHSSTILPPFLVWNEDEDGEDMRRAMKHLINALSSNALDNLRFFNKRIREGVTFLLM